MYAKKENAYFGYVSKNNSTRKKQVIFQMIPNAEKCESKYKPKQRNHLIVKKLLALLRGITSKHNGESHHCLN